MDAREVMLVECWDAPGAYNVMPAEARLAPTEPEN
jgi:hypothetical protein